ncbi:hypothetical protein LCGC14_0953390 [marine sediment metagenome]|uniref:Uncharacterized protein n=1 Tax=marine sediment metagenome TaxID=412755 RepID=A0A0F9QZX1_9ZZZZ|nr:hypothetical protein [bacterium]
MIKNKIIQKIRFITGKRYLYLEKELDKLSPVALSNLTRMLRDIEYEINSLKRKRLYLMR